MSEWQLDGHPKLSCGHGAGPNEFYGTTDSMALPRPASTTPPLTETKKEMIRHERN